ncbi:MAG: ABC transporter permease [Ignisphaera sp.]
MSEVIALMEQIILYLKYVLLTTVPYILAGLGMSISGRSGIFIVYNEGLMLAGASATFLTTYLTGGDIFLGLIAGISIGVVFGLIMAYFTVTLKLNQFVIGLALFIMGLGIGNLMYKLVIGVVLVPPRIPLLQDVYIPFLSDIPIVGPVLFQQNILFYLSILLALIIHYFMFKTAWGLNFRSVGENPKVADSMGINVFLIRYIATVLGSVLIALAGSYLPLAFTGTYTESIVGGRGWITIALTLFGKWSPLLIMLGSMIFAGTEAFVYRLQVAGLALPYQFLLMVPFLVTLVILIQVYRRAEMPQALGRPYDREAIEE